MDQRAHAAAKAAVRVVVEVRDSAGSLLADGDSVTLIKDLKVKGAGQTLKRGTVIKSIKLTGDDQEIDCRFDGIKGLVLRASSSGRRRGSTFPSPSWEGDRAPHGGWGAGRTAVHLLSPLRGQLPHQGGARTLIPTRSTA